MTALAIRQPCSVHRKLIELLEEARRPIQTPAPTGFDDRLDALEVEAVVNCAPDSTLVMIRVAREAVGFAESIAGRLARAQRSPLAEAGGTRTLPHPAIL